jgi:hypothetical protein
VTTYAALRHATWLGGYDMTGDLNETSLDISLDELIADVFTTGVGVVGRRRIAGRENVEAMVKGLWQSAASGAVDPEAFTGLGSAVPPCTQSVSGAEGDVAYMWQPRKMRYQIGGKGGEIFPFELGLKSGKSGGGPAVGAVRGRVLKVGSVSGTGATGTVVQAGAVAADEFIYFVIHTFAIGTSFTLQLQSDDAVGFPSATTRATSPSITAVGGTWVARVAGPVTDTFWRINVSAASGTSSIAASVGIK